MYVGCNIYWDTGFTLGNLANKLWWTGLFQKLDRVALQRCRTNKCVFCNVIGVWKNLHRKQSMSVKPEKWAEHDSPDTRLDSLVPRPHPLTRKRIWWLLSDFLVVMSQQNTISHVTWVAIQRWGWGLGTRLWIGLYGQSIQAHTCIM